MPDGLGWLRTWVTFAGWVLVAAVLYWAQAVIVPVVLAGLFVFLLSTPANWLERRVGKVASVIAVLLLTFGTIAGIGWAFGYQLTGLARQLPAYQANIDQKIAQLQDAGKDGPLSRVEETIREIQDRAARKASPDGTRSQPLVVTQARRSWGLPTWISPLFAPLSNAVFVGVMVMFMLFERQDLRNRLLQLFAHGHLAVTTKAFEEAANRVSRYLAMQSLVNAIYGVALGLGLYVLDVPYPLLWGCFAAVARFIPYLGPLLAAAGPLAIAFAALPGWSGLASVAIYVGVLELLTNFVLETVLYAGAAGVSQVALLVAVAFWTWLWGPLGLLMATPLTVCLVVIGKHVNGLEFVATLMSDSPALDPHVSFYQRLLAHDLAEAAEHVERYAAEHSREEVFDGLLLPVLNYAERDRLEGHLETEEEQAIIAATRELTLEFASPATHTTETPARAAAVMGVPLNGEADVLALEMLSGLMRDVATIDIVSPRVLTSELIELIRTSGCRVVCLADLPPSAPSKARYLTKRLRATFPQLRIVIGRWAPPGLADDDRATLIEAGATHVDTTLRSSRDNLREAVHHVALSAQSTAPPQAA
jgi:predicted PurR-regulated permease PerM